MIYDVRHAALALLCTMLVTLAGCGGNASSKPTASAPTSPPPTPTPPTPTPSPTPTPTPSAPTTFDFVMARFALAMSDAGRIKVNANANDGAGSITVAVGQANTPYSLTFCPFRASCFNVEQFPSSGISAEVSGTFTFPQKGTWSGVFVLTSANGDRSFTSGFIAGISNLPPSVAHFVTAASVTGGVSGFQAGSDPLGSGTISIDAMSNVSVQLSGAAPNASYSFTQCDEFTSQVSGICTEALGTLMTDGSGNGSVSLMRQDNSPAIWMLTRNGAGQFVSGFVVK